MSLFVKILRKRAEARKEYSENFEVYVKKIGKYFKDKLGEARVFVFGSIVDGSWDSESDIDVLVISPSTPPYLYQRSKLIAEIKFELGRFNPFEIHLITPEEYKEWYSNFIKNNYKEVHLE